MREVEVYIPVRIDLSGGATDISPFRDREGGRIISMAINLDDVPSVCVTASQIPEKVLVLRNEDGLLEERIDSWESLRDYRTPLKLLKVASMKKMQGQEAASFSDALTKTFGGGVRCSVKSSTPKGSGLGTSGAIGVAAVQALDLLSGSNLTYLSQQGKYEVAAQANALEHQDLAITSGGQDQLAAMFGGFNDITFTASGVIVQPFAVPSDAQEEFERRSLIVYTGQSRVSGESLDRMMENYRSGNKRTVRALRGIKALGEEMRRALEEGDISKAGRLLRKSWKFRLGLHDEISNKEIDQLMQQVNNLVEGGYVCGAGGGGCTYFIAKRGKENELKRRVAELGHDSYSVSLNPSGMSTLIDRSKVRFFKPEDLADVQRGRYNTESTMAILLNPQGEILLNLRDDKPGILYPAHWAILGGELTPGEVPFTGLQRELREEIGYVPPIAQEYGKIIDRDGRGHLVTVYVGKIDRSLDQLTLGEGAELRFFDKSKLPGLKITPFLKEVVMHYFFSS